MKKLITIFATLLLIAQPQSSRAYDEWMLACAPLAVTTGALVISACYLCKQARTISLLRQEVSTKQALIDALTQERDEKAQTLSTWQLIVKKLHEFIPFMCIKENITPEQFKKLFGDIGFDQSEREHKVPGLVTLISRSSNFTAAEKNLVSDEEDSLEDRNRILNEIEQDLAKIHEQIDGK